MTKSEDSEPAPTELTMQTDSWVKKAIMLFLMATSESVAASFLVPFVGFMVQDFGFRPEQIGFYSGLIISSYFLANLISSYPIGIISDYWGRRPVILIGSLANVICILMFGMSFNIWWAVAWRACNGFFNANNGILKCYIREISTQQTQARIYSIRSAGYAIGSVIGPLVGGLLCNPEKISWLLNIQLPILQSWPYLLPCIVASGINAISLILALVYLQETLQKTSPTVVWKSDDSNSCIEDELDTFDNPQYVEEGSYIHPQEEDEEVEFGKFSIQSQSGLTPLDFDFEDQQETNKKCCKLGRFFACCCGTRNKKDEATEFEIVSQSNRNSFFCCSKDSTSTSTSTSTSFASAVPKRGFLRHLWSKTGLSNCQVVLVVVLYAAMALAWMVLVQSFPIWAMRPIDQNGLGFRELQIGALQALGGVAMMVLQLFMFPWLSRVMGHRWLFRATCALWLVAVFFLPESHWLTADPADSAAPLSPWSAGYWTWKMALLWVWLALCVMTMYSQYSLNMASVNLMITNAANADQVGRVSGVALALAAFSRTVAPLGTAVFSHSAEGDGWLWNYRFVFWACAALGLLVLLTSFGISRNTSEGRNTRVGGSSLHKNSSVSARRSFSQGNLSEAAGYSVVSATEVVKEEDD